MAIVFNCPHCGTNYRLKDEFGGKTATCKNPNCRKVIPIPKAKEAVLASAPADLDAIAAAAFSDEPAAKGPAAAEETIEVTCSGCDHKWTVEASKEGKNVLCPECRRPNRVPMRKKEEKADWRTGGGGPSLAKRETGMDVQGAFTSANVGSIGTQTAKEILKGREAEEEPEERRKKLLKRGVLFVLVASVLGAGGYYLFKEGKQRGEEHKIEDAVAEVTTGESGTKDVRYHALIHRAAGEHFGRTADKAEEAKKALDELKKARNLLDREKPGIDRNCLLAEVAVTMVELLGTPEQVAAGTRLKQDDVIQQIRETLKKIDPKDPDAPDVYADVLRAVTRKFAAKGLPAAPLEIARQLHPPDEMRGQVGLELLKIDREKYRPEVEKLLGSITTNDAPAVQALRLLVKPAGKKDDPAASPSNVAIAEFEALSGNTAKAGKSAGSATKPDDKVRALIAAAQAAPEAQAADASALTEQAAGLIRKDPTVVRPSVAIRACRVMGRLGQFDSAEALAAKLDPQAQGWARLEILRGRLAQAKTQKADDTWLDAVGDPTKLPPAAKAYEEVARHNAATNNENQAKIKSWEKGTVRPFGVAGTILGRGDR